MRAWHCLREPKPWLWRIRSSVNARHRSRLWGGGRGWLDALFGALFRRRGCGVGRLFLASLLSPHFLLGFAFLLEFFLAFLECEVGLDQWGSFLRVRALGGRRGWKGGALRSERRRRGGGGCGRGGAYVTTLWEWGLAGVRGGWVHSGRIPPQLFILRKARSEGVDAGYSSSCAAIVQIRFKGNSAFRSGSRRS